MERGTANRVVREYRTTHQAGPAEVFPLLCPVREYDWIPGWRCDVIYSETGFAELGCVFRTDFGDHWGPEVWVVSHYQPAEKIAFVRTGNMRATRYVIELEGDRDEPAITHLLWRQELTALHPRGVEPIAAFSESVFQTAMASLNAMLAHYLATGTALPPDAASTASKRKKA